MNQVAILDLVEQLTKISPMPSDKVLMEEDEGENLLDEYDRIIMVIGKKLNEETITAEIEEKLIQALLFSFGLGGGMGVYWGTLHILEKLNPALVYPIVQKAAIHGNEGCSYWCCFILGRRRNLDDLMIFLSLLRSNITDIQIQALKSLTMLSQKYDIEYVSSDIAPLTIDINSTLGKAAQKTLDDIVVNR